MRNANSAGVLYACKGAHTIEIRDLYGTHSIQRSERERERERERKRERKRKGGRERCIICPELLFLFLKAMMGALAPFSYLV